MILFVAWLMFGIELFVAIAFGITFWRLWSRSAMGKTTALAAIAMYAFCCVLCLMLTFFVPL
jgi:hypothetical protein